MDAYTIPLILLFGLILGISSGFVMHRSDFCIAGMFRDFFLFKSSSRINPMLLLVVSAMLLFESARQLGLLPVYPFPLIGSPSLANVFGGLLFGIGMVLAGGCVVGTLYKMGSGSILGVVTLAGLVCGSTLYAEIHPWWSGVVKGTTFFASTITIPQLLGIDPLALVVLAAAVASIFFYRIHRRNGWTRLTFAEGYLQPWKAALILSLISTLSYVVIGMPMGITTAYAKIGSYAESLVSADHVSSLAYFRSEPLNYRHPWTGIQLSGGPGPAFDGIAIIQFPVIAGIVFGSACSALLLKEFKMYVKVPLRQYLSAAVGGVIMGMASRMAPACNIWHLIGGLPIMALQSILFIVGMVPGAWLGALLLSRLVIRQ